MSASTWIADRLPSQAVHLDVAACGRVSQAVLDVQLQHLRAEAEVGGYVAEAQAAPTVDAGRAALGAMVGRSGSDVFFAEGAGAAFAVLLDAWPLPPGSRIGTVTGEYGGNARVLRSRAALRGWELVHLPVDGLGRVLDVPAGLDLVTFPQVASQRGVVQPVREVMRHGAPLLLDVAQSLGQVDVPAGAAAYVGTSRKWLCGPRGVGFGVVSPDLLPRLAPPPTLGALTYGDVRSFDSLEAHLAGRVGLALAARTWSPAVLPVLLAAAAAGRVLLEGAGGWSVVEPVEEPTGITTLRHPTADPDATRAALLAQGFVTTSVPTWRSDDLDTPVLRISTAAWITPGDLERLVEVLPGCTA